MDGRQLQAVPQALLVKDPEGAGQVYARQAVAALEAVLAQGVQGGAKIHLCNIVIILEGVVAYGGHVAGKGHGGDVILVGRPGGLVLKVLHRPVAGNHQGAALQAPGNALSAGAGGRVPEGGKSQGGQDRAKECQLEKKTLHNDIPPSKGPLLGEGGPAKPGRVWGGMQNHPCTAPHPPLRRHLPPGEGKGLVHGPLGPVKQDLHPLPQGLGLRRVGLAVGFDPILGCLLGIGQDPHVHR